MSFFAQVPQQIVNGISLGSVYGLIAIGYSMVYGTLGMLNFAHGEVFMVGAFGGWLAMGLLLPFLSGPTLLLPVTVAASLTAAVVGVATERFAYRPLRRAPRLAPLIAALGVSMFLQNAVMLATGGRAKTYLTSAIVSPDAGVMLGGTFISFLRLMVVAVAALLMLVLDYLVRHTYTGKAMRAVAEDPEAAAWTGVSVNRVVAAAFLLGSLLAGVGGVMVGLLYSQVDFYMGFSAGMKAFTACVLGGIGNLHGAMVGGVVLGLLESLGVAFVSPVYRDVIAFSLLILTLVLRPQGILGRARGQRA